MGDVRAQSPGQVYRLTPAGRKRLRQEKTEWAKFVAGVAMIMNPAAGEVD
jgi:DNA-binding PadR family transcriptional regulator